MLCCFQDFGTDAGVLSSYFLGTSAHYKKRTHWAHRHFCGFTRLQQEGDIYCFDAFNSLQQFTARIFIFFSFFFSTLKCVWDLLIDSLFFSPRWCHFSSRNCQVTMIKNLEVYGLDPAAVATALQRRVQASSILQPIPGSKDKVLVQIQGNQIHQVGTMLLGL